MKLKLGQKTNEKNRPIVRKKQMTETSLRTYFSCAVSNVGRFCQIAVRTKKKYLWIDENQPKKTTKVNWDRRRCETDSDWSNKKANYFAVCQDISNRKFLRRLKEETKRISESKKLQRFERDAWLAFLYSNSILFWPFFFGSQRWFTLSSAFFGTTLAKTNKIISK